MSTPDSIVDGFIAAFYRGDSARARTYLADDCHFVGPAAEYDSAEEYLRSSAHAAPLVKEIERRKIFSDASDVCVVHDLHLKHSVSILPMAEWYHVKENKITSIRTYFDTAPFVAASVKKANASADAVHTDPVCHMAVNETSAATSRIHKNTTYYFCNTGCAIAFEKQPAKYV